MLLAFIWFGNHHVKMTQLNVFRQLNLFLKSVLFCYEAKSQWLFKNFPNFNSTSLFFILFFFSQRCYLFSCPSSSPLVVLFFGSFSSANSSSGLVRVPEDFFSLHCLQIISSPTPYVVFSSTSRHPSFFLFFGSCEFQSIDSWISQQLAGNLKKKKKGP